MKTFGIILLVIVVSIMAMFVGAQNYRILDIQEQLDDTTTLALHSYQKNKEQDALIKQLTGTDYELKEPYLFKAEPHKINY